ncbi:oligosaccharide flippase family protein [Thermomonas sp. S9]|uniref:oligosaccharide flippase family protein n=1 Tax=Thermomonas sp. S9 TaxID=2885203 RepID=UPI00216B2933|nr:oligosaccharide flippase family protein [Thermomonas sp. S9]MCR6496037.1 oligosaccharide flippase family protein [Thermomonas sp. S9]
MIRRLHYHLAGNGLGATLLKSVGGATGVSMLGMAFTFLLGWQLARGLGAAGYGIYGVAMAVVSMLGVPSQFGLPQLLTREVAAANAVHDWGRLNGVVRWALVLPFGLRLEFLPY